MAAKGISSLTPYLVLANLLSLTPFAKRKPPSPLVQIIRYQPSIPLQEFVVHFISHSQLLVHPFLSTKTIY
ncbi:hypothetical protein BKA61DRAFT_588208 [Leptodontidium sp. MPI-SDFR-AT-0119]|nr:hypothetical protein BKA61DRAFT_588208 [Leptodontidium sp. MPI-SDFR-AT-0119]